MPNYALQTNDNYSWPKGGLNWLPFYNAYIIDVDTPYPQTPITIGQVWITISDIITPNCVAVGDPYNGVILPDNTPDYKSSITISFRYKVWDTNSNLLINDAIFTITAYGTLPQTNLKGSVIKNILGSSSSRWVDLLKHANINEFSLNHWLPSGLPGHPNKTAPYKLSDFKCYSHNYPQIIGRPYVNVFWNYIVTLADPAYVCFCKLVLNGVEIGAGENDDNGSAFRMYEGDVLSIYAYIYSGPANPASGVVINIPDYSPLENWAYEFGTNYLKLLDYQWSYQNWHAWNEQHPITIDIYASDET